MEIGSWPWQIMFKFLSIILFLYCPLIFLFSVPILISFSMYLYFSNIYTSWGTCSMAKVGHTWSSKEDILLNTTWKDCCGFLEISNSTSCNINYILLYWLFVWTFLSDWEKELNQKHQCVLSGHGESVPPMDNEWLQVDSRHRSRFPV